MPISNELQLKHIYEAEDALGKAGITFDSGSNIADDGKVMSRDWELDWSLVGATLIPHEEQSEK